MDERVEQLLSLLREIQEKYPSINGISLDMVIDYDLDDEDKAWKMKKITNPERLANYDGGTLIRWVDSKFYVALGCNQFKFKIHNPALEWDKETIKEVIEKLENFLGE